jgi:hemoglobin-like flavoprotein
MNELVTAEQRHLLRKSFRMIESQTHVAALIFYQRLFELDPSLRRLFHTDIEEQAKKLMEMLGLALSMLEQRRAFEIELEGLGARHVTYGVLREHYATVGQAMLYMLARVLDGEWTSAVRTAWTEFYGLISEVMLRGAARVSDASAAQTERR